MATTLLTCLVFALLLVSVQGFAPMRSPISQPRMQRTQLSMGGKQSKFGIFSPLVIVVKTALGETKFNKLRGKAISLHSQAITEWCLQYGAYNLRLRLIKKAKKNGDELGFLI